MKLKKTNAVLSLLAILLLLLHVCFTIYAYLTFFYSPLLTKLFAVPFLVVVCLHAICGMTSLFLQGDGTSPLYPKQNSRTVLQRVSAALIFPFLILHLNTFDLLQTCSENGRTAFLILLLIAQLLFYAVVMAHIAVSFSKALITLGLLTSEKRQAVLDKVVYVLSGILFVGASYSVIHGQAFMFLSSGGAA